MSTSVKTAIACSFATATLDCYDPRKHVHSNDLGCRNKADTPVFHEPLNSHRALAPIVQILPELSVSSPYYTHDCCASLPKKQTGPIAHGCIWWTWMYPYASLWKCTYSHFSENVTAACHRSVQSSPCLHWHGNSYAPFQPCMLWNGSVLTYALLHALKQFVAWLIILSAKGFFYYLFVLCRGNGHIWKVL